MTYLQLVPALCISLVGLVLACVFRHRLGRAAWLAFAAFGVLAAVYGGSLIWLHHFLSVNLFGHANADEEVLRLTALSNRLHWWFATGSVVGFALLIAAVLTGPRAGTAGRTDDPTG
ncbi:hypothetical protein [Actinoplanes sp. NPDC049118]|uniref:hypothetical protein n=1 Tax=Actinoplanes sp. NPDC049118 TaxID=3155769 RepID=UPI0033C8637D